MPDVTTSTFTPLILVFSLLLIGVAGYWVWTMPFAPSPCDPQTAYATLQTLSDKGIRKTGHGSSLTNLLWIYVGSMWHALPLKEKQSIDKIVSCAATTLDHQGQPMWQAAYYDETSGKLTALTSTRYGFRLKVPE